MMIKRIIFIIFIVSLGVVVSAQQNTLTVNISGIKNIKGDIYVYLYTTDEGFPIETEQATRFKKIKIDRTNMTTYFNNLKQGTYAVSVYHDIDGNGKLNQNFLGVPKEPVGVSNNATGFMGPPEFEDAKFNISKNKSINIKFSEQ